jgi:hypothetical protein
MLSLIVVAYRSPRKIGWRAMEINPTNKFTSPGEFINSLACDKHSSQNYDSVIRA